MPHDDSPILPPGSSRVASLPQAPLAFVSAAFDILDDGLFAIDRHGYVLWLNPAAERLLGLGLDDLRRLFRSGDRLLRADGSPLPDEERPSSLALRTRQTVRDVVIGFVAEDRQLRWMRVSAKPMFAAAGDLEGVLVSLHDITERQEMAARLRASLAEADDLYQHAPCGYHSVGPDGRYLRVNDTELAWIGRSREEVIGRMRPSEFLTHESRTAFEAAFARLLDTGELLRVEVDLLDGAGRTRRMSVRASVVRDAAGRFLMSRTVMHDVTELAEARRRLEHLAREQAAMLDNDVIGLARIREGRIVWANAAVHRLFGFEPGELVGQSLSALHPAAGRYPSLREASARTFEDGGRFRTQVEARRPDGTPVFVDAYGTTLDPVAGDALWVLADITPVRAAQRQLLHTQKMESVARLAGGVAHDFNNMLQAILGTAELAMADLPPGSPLIRDLQQIREAAQRSATLTQQLLTFAGRQFVAPVPVSPNEAVTSALPLLRRLLPMQAALDWRPGIGVPTIRIDPAQFDHLLMNLVLNAWESLDGVGTVTIETQFVTVGPDEVAGRPGARPGAFVRLTVTDTGRGMAPDTLLRAFEPFFTTKEFGRNSGLGLATVYGIAVQHGGWAALDSQVGLGTAASVYLPRLEARAPGGPSLPSDTGRALDDPPIRG